MTDNKMIVEKAKKAGHSVFSVQISGETFTYRSFSRKEYREMQETITAATEQARASLKDNEQALAKELDKISEASQDSLVLRCLLSPECTQEQIENMPGGVIPALADLIMQASGFGVEATPVKL